MTARTSEGDPAVAGERRWALLVLALPAFLVAMDQNVLLLALPALAGDLGASVREQLWITDVYGLMIAALLIPAGALTDRLGARPVLLAGASAFALLSVLAAFATGPEMLIGVRALMGAAGATLGPASLAMIAHLFPDPAARARAVGLWMTCFMVGMISGPVVGGMLLGWFWWGSVFLLGVPAMLLLAIAGPRVLPSPPGSRGARLDVLGVALSMAALLVLVLGLKRAVADGLTGAALATLAVGAALAWSFLRRLRTSEAPVIPPDLVRSRRLVAAVGVMCACAVVIAGTYLLLTQHLQLVADLDPLRAGLVVVLPALAFALGAMAGPVIAARIAAHHVLAAGLVVAAAGLAVVGLAAARGDLALLVAGFSTAYLGFGPGASIGTDLVIGAAPSRQAGTAASLSETGTELGQALGVALLGSVGALLYRRSLVEDAGAESVAAGLSDFSAADLPGAAGVAAEGAYASAFQAVALGGAGVVLLLALAASVVLRPRGS